MEMHLVTIGWKLPLVLFSLVRMKINEILLPTNPSLNISPK
jgi:hypothetical protein